MAEVNNKWYYFDELGYGQRLEINRK
ncbi:MAG: hypothetical protein ACLR43_02000 [Faecalibacillus faecis]